MVKVQNLAELTYLVDIFLQQLTDEKVLIVIGFHIYVTVCLLLYPITGIMRYFYSGQ